ncbi:MAG: tetratricopeptide repeat protein [bacterium]
MDNLTYYLEILKLEPDNISALKGLAEIYKAGEQWDKLVEVYEKLFSLSEDDDERITYITGVADIYYYKLNDTNKAVEFYLDALELNPYDQNAIDRLKEIMKASNALPALNILLEGENTISKEPQRINDNKLILINNYVLLSRYEEALNLISTLTPPPENLVKELYNELIKNHQISKIIEYKDLFVNSFNTPEARANLYSTIAQIYEENTDDVYEVAYNYEMALASDAENKRDILRKLSEIYKSFDEPILILSILLSLKAFATPEELPELNKQIGMSYLKIGDKASTLSIFKEVLSVNPYDRSLLYTMLDLVNETGDTEETVSIVKRLIQLEDDNNKRLLLYEKAIPLLMDQKDYETATKLINSIVEIKGDQTWYQYLEKIYIDTHDYNNLINFYLERLQGKEDEPASAKLWASLGEAYLNGFSHYEYAIDSYSRASALEPENKDYLEKLISLYLSTERWQDAEQAMIKILSLSTDDSKKLSIQLALGDLYLSHLNDKDKAIAIYNQVLSNNPDNPIAMSALEELYRKTGNSSELVNLLEKRLATATNRYDILVELGLLMSEKDINVKKAQEYLWQALEMKPSDQTAINALNKLYETTGDYEGFEKLYSFIIDKTNPPAREKIDLLVKLGHIQHEKLALQDKAISTFEKVLSLEPAHPEANLSLANLYFNAGIWEKAEPYFRFSIEHNLVEQQILPDFLFRYARVLDKLNKQQDALQFYKKAFELNPGEKKYAIAYGYSAYINHKYSDVITAFEDLIKLHPDIDNLDDIHKKLASAYEEIHNYRSASVYLLKLINKEPDNHEYLKWLERVCENGKDYMLLVSVLKKESDLSKKDDEIINIALKRASIQDEQLNDPQSAIKTLEELINSGRRHMDAYLKLISLYKKVNNKDAIISAIHETLKFELTKEFRINLLVDLAGLHADDKQKSIGIYREILSLDPQNKIAFESLCRLYEASNDYPAIVDIYQKRLDNTQNQEEKIALLNQLATIKSEKLNDTNGAITIYHKLLEYTPADIQVYNALESLLLKQNEFSKLSELYRSATRNIDKKDIKFTYFVKLAELLSEKLKDEKNAILAYEAAISIDKTNSDIIIKAARLASNQHMDDKAIALYKDAIKFNNLSEEIKAEINFEYGKLLQYKGLDNEAFQAFKNAYNLKPSSIDYRLAYGESAYAAGLYKDAYDVLKNIVYAHEQELQPEQLFPIYKILSDTAKRLGNIQQAVEYLLRAVDINDKDIESLVTLDELTSTLGNYELEIEVLTKLSKLLVNPMDRAQVFIKIAKLKHDKTYDLNGAIALLREAMAIMPENLQIYNELLQIYREQSNIDNEIEILVKLLKLDKDTNNLTRIATRLGQIYVEFKNDPDTAKKYFLEALKIQPSSVNALMGLGNIFELQGNPAGKAELYQKFIKVLLPKEPKSVIPLIKELAELYATKLNNPELAIQQYQTLTNIEPSDVNAHFMLAELLSKNKTTIPDAVREYGIVIKFMPQNTVALRALSRYYEQKKDYDRQFLYLSTLKLLGEEKDLERIFVEANKNKQPQQPKLPLTDELFLSHIMHIKARGPLKEIVGLSQDIIKNIYKPDLKLYGAGKQERLSPKTVAWQEYAPLLQIMDIKDIDIYHTSKGDFKPVIENTSPPSLIINTSTLSNLSAREKTFVITEYLTYIKYGFLLPVKLNKDRFRLFINAMKKVLNPSLTTPDDKDPEFLKITSALNNEIGKKQRASLDELIKKYNMMPESYMDEWFKGIEMTAVRTAAFMIGDIESIFSALVKWHIRDVSLLSNKEKRKDVFSSSELMQDVLQFFLSDSHFLLRSKLGMSITSV